MSVTSGYTSSIQHTLIRPLSLGIVYTTLNVVLCISAVQYIVCVCV